MQSHLNWTYPKIPRCFYRRSFQRTKIHCIDYFSRQDVAARTVSGSAVLYAWWRLWQRWWERYCGVSHVWWKRTVFYRNSGNAGHKNKKLLGTRHKLYRTISRRLRSQFWGSWPRSKICFLLLTTRSKWSNTVPYILSCCPPKFVPHIAHEAHLAVEQAGVMVSTACMI